MKIREEIANNNLKIEIKNTISNYRADISYIEQGNLNEFSVVEKGIQNLKKLDLITVNFYD